METSNPASGFPPPARAPVGRRILPVLDVMGGQVVRAVAGRRSEYRPVRSVLTNSTDPRAVAGALVTATWSECLYLADLDAITRGCPDFGPMLAIQTDEVAVLYDGGFRTADELRACDRAGGRYFVVGSETAGPAVLAGAPVDRIVVSIDLFGGQLLGDWRAWGVSGPRAAVEVADAVLGRGVERLIILDLARVGTGCGSGTEHLVTACKDRYPGCRVIAGGGVRDWSDVDRLVAAGADRVLVASALHDGSITLPRPAS